MSEKWLLTGSALGGLGRADELAVLSIEVRIGFFFLLLGNDVAIPRHEAHPLLEEKDKLRQRSEFTGTPHPTTTRDKASIWFSFLSDEESG